MSKATDLLASLSADEINAYSAGTGSEEPHIVIGRDRIIKVPEELKRLGVERDHNIETVTFDCPRYWDGLDMSKMQIYVNYVLSSGYKDSYPVDNVTVDNDIMHFSWTISANVTQKKGTVIFLVCIKKTDENDIEVNHWNSELCKDCYISEGMETEEGVPMEYSDLYSQLLERMASVEQINIEAAVMEQLLNDTRSAAAAAEEAKEIALDSSDYIKNSYAPAVKGNVSGPIVRVDDVSPIEHTVKVKVGSENLIPYPYDSAEMNANGQATVNGVTFVDNKDGSITASGTVPDGVFANVMVKRSISLVDGVTYYVGNSPVLLLAYKKADGTIKYLKNEVFTWSKDYEFIQLYIQYQPGTVVDETIYPMLCIANMPTEYVPYVDPSTVTLTRCGKNLFDSSKLLLANGWTESNGVYSGLPGTLHNIYGPNVGSPILSRFKPSTQYTLSFDAYAEITSDRPVGGTFMIYYDDGSHNGKIINTSTMSRYTYTSDPGKTIVGLYISYGHNVKTYIKNIQVEEGTTVTPYESYNGETVKPSTDGTVEFTSLSPTMTLFTDTADTIVEVEYNRDTTKMFESYVLTDEAKNDIAALVEEDMADVLVALNNYASQVIGGDS